jgi:hypothetical protein
VDIWVPSQKEAKQKGIVKNIVLRVYPKGYKPEIKEKEEDVSQTK